MPVTSPNRERIRDGSFAFWGTRNWAWLSLGLVFLALLALAWHGREEARRQDRVNQIVVVRDELEHKLNGEESQRWANPSGELPDATVTSLSVDRLADILGRGLRDFDVDYRSSSLTPAQRSDIRLSRAVLSRAQGQFQQVLDMLGPVKGLENGPVLATRDAELLGAAFFGLHEWKSALDCFKRVVDARPIDLFARARIVDCEATLGATSNAAAAQEELARARNCVADDLLVGGKWDAAAREFATCSDRLSRRFKEKAALETALPLAASFTGQGDSFLLQEKFEAAGNAYGKAVEVLSSADGQPRAAGADPLSASLLDRGNALFLQRKLPQAEVDYARAVDRLRALAKEAAPKEVFEQLAVALRDVGNVHVAEQKLNAALDEYREALEFQTRLESQERAPWLSSELAITRNNRGAVLRARHDLPGAVEDFNSASDSLTRVISETRPPEDRPRVSLDVLVGYTETSLDLMTRTHLPEGPARGEPAVALAFALRNRAYAQMERGDLARAVQDFGESAARWQELVERAGQMDLAPQFARTLSALAWVRATAAEPSVRDGAKARAEAEKACALTAEKVYVPLAVLAAACAATGDFGSAVQWEKRAIAVAPNRQQAPLQERLALFEAGRPFRAGKGAVIAP